MEKSTEKSSSRHQQHDDCNCKNQRRSVAKFLKRTYQMLQENKFSDLVSWSPDGTSLVVKKPYDFAEKVLPFFFKHNNFQSFIRQLNKYNFKKDKKSSFDHTYSHEFFQKSKPDALANIQRKKSYKTANANLNLSPQESNEQTLEAAIRENGELHNAKARLASQLDESKTQLLTLNQENELIQSEFQKQKQANELLKNFMNNINRPLIGPHANQISQQDEINITRPPQKNVFSYMQAQDAAYLDFINTNWHLIPNSDFSLYQEPAFEQPSKFTLNQAENFGLSLQNPYLRPFNNENRAYNAGFPIPNPELFSKAEDLDEAILSKLYGHHNQ